MAVLPILRMAIKYQHFPFRYPPKYAQIAIFGTKYIIWQPWREHQPLQLGAKQLLAITLDR
jgi:hypothetical protein